MILDIGLNILSNFRISIGEDFDNILKLLKTKQIEYSIPFKTANSCLVYIESLGMELRLDDNKVSFIKTTNNDLNYIMTLKEHKPVQVLNEIRENLAKKFEIQDTKKIYIDRFETRTFNSVITIPYTDGYKVKINLILGRGNSIFIETIELIKIT